MDFSEFEPAQTTGRLGTRAGRWKRGALEPKQIWGIYEATGNLRAVRILLGQIRFENTVRYLVVDIEDALGLAEGTGI